MLFQNDPFVLIYIFTFLFHIIALVEQELLTLPEHLSSPPVFSGVHVNTRSLILCVCFVDHLCPFVLFLLAIELSVLLLFTDSDYHHIFLYEVVPAMYSKHLIASIHTDKKPVKGRKRHQC